MKSLLRELVLLLIEIGVLLSEVELATATLITTAASLSDNAQPTAATNKVDQYFTTGVWNSHFTFHIVDDTYNLLIK